MRKEERRRKIVMLAEARQLRKDQVRLRASEDSARRLFQSLLLTGLIRPRRQDSWRIILAAPPAGPRAS